MSNCSNCMSLNQGIFCDLNSSELSSLSKHKVTNFFKKGQTLFIEDNPSFGIYCISKGNIKLTQLNSEGKESIIRIASPGDILGHRSLFTTEHYSATATAIEDTEVCFVDKEYILKLVSSKPSVSKNIIEKLSLDLGAAESRLSSFSQKNVKQRLAELLLLLKESHGVETEEGVLINLKLTREEMSSLVGTAPETLIRFMSEIKKSKSISESSKKITINDEKKLLEIADIHY